MLGTGESITMFSRSSVRAVVLAGLAVLGANTSPAQTFLETFNNAPDYSNNWQLAQNYGATILTYTPGNIRLQASRSAPYPPGSSIGFLSNQTFSGDVDLTVELNHQGFGRTTVGLFGVSGITPLITFDLDTDDVPYLFTSVHGHEGRTRSNGPYLNRWITLRIKIEGNQAEFFADGVLLETIPYPTPAGQYRTWFSAGSVPWKSGDSDTSFRLVQATGTYAGRFTYPVDLTDVVGGRQWHISQNFGSLNNKGKPHLGEDWNWGGGLMTTTSPFTRSAMERFSLSTMT